ncbi:class A beta-lactamase-related serine hydrolase [Kitasatospora sp. NBC_00374]|uniref:serine hydrolase n=1 Tax=Kitasatospora sp. NBC_00374 TaxID=2975964 RepID=UPI0032497DE8
MPNEMAAAQDGLSPASAGRSTLSVHVGPLAGGPVRTLRPNAPHLAASTMKVAVLAALHRSGLDLDAPVPVHNSFVSASYGPRFGVSREEDSDPEPWQALGSERTLRWLAGRMIVHSSNLATNLCLSHVGPAAVAEVWQLARARHSVTGRGIDDLRARAAGVVNLVTAADLARLLRRLPQELLDLLAANAHRVDLAAGLPPGTRIAFKNGWLPGVRHSGGIVYPPDAPPYGIVVCYSGPLATGHAVDDPAARLLARISAGYWARRHELGTPGDR